MEWGYIGLLIRDCSLYYFSHFCILNKLLDAYYILFTSYKLITVWSSTNLFVDNLLCTDNQIEYCATYLHTRKNLPDKTNPRSCYILLNFVQRDARVSLIIMFRMKSNHRLRLKLRTCKIWWGCWYPSGRVLCDASHQNEGNGGE